MPIALNKAMATIKETSKTMLINVGNKQAVIHMDDILYLERVKRYTYIVTKNDKLRVKENFITLQQMLSSQFLRCHNSFIVNFNKVTAVKRNAFILDTLTIPISRSYQKKCEFAFHKYIIHTL